MIPPVLPYIRLLRLVHVGATWSESMYEVVGEEGGPGVNTVGIGEGGVGWESEDGGVVVPGGGHWRE